MRILLHKFEIVITFSMVSSKMDFSNFFFEYDPISAMHINLKPCDIATRTSKPVLFLPVNR